jgi:hypothetical protein
MSNCKRCIVVVYALLSYLIGEGVEGMGVLSECGTQAGVSTYFLVSATESSDYCE